MTVPTGRAAAHLPSLFRYRVLCGLLVATDSVITLFPPLYWNVDGPAAALIYVIGGSALVAASIPALYLLGARCGRDRWESM
ncbi:hypothetical protein [Streptomyces rishiriensis]|uniref:MFS transporter n=1 Tax=Streptomyces rishiriensis TaxID=68264 RepID=A0ABU0NHG0_STRRH|nr:hypothetical protein [Streptomyces rishiriensis]MDQ0578067.1 hypothetical protein [Streptomyces rishiriensis]